MGMARTAQLLIPSLLLALSQACTSPQVAITSPSSSPSPSPTAVLTPAPEQFPTPTLDPASPWGLLIPPYEYEDGTTIIDGPTFIDGVVFDINGSDVFELCITRGYACAEYEDIIPIRLIQIDAPDPFGECYGEMAELELAKLLLEGMPVSITTDPNLPEEDADGILQAWVWNSEFLVNLEMVKRGAAAPYFPDGAGGAFDQRLLNAARKAKASGRGLWGECLNTQLNVDRPLNTDRD
jgi:endonuclease YncB( thermonuclease family)